MKRCVSDRTLWLVAEGEATAADRDHVQSCVACTARYQRLDHDLATLRVALSGAPPRRMVRQSAVPVRWHWPTATAAVVLIALAWGSLWFQGPSWPNLAPVDGQEAVASFLAEVSLALFASADAELFGEVAWPAFALDSPVPSVAVDDEWGCDSEPLWFDVQCETQPFLLLAGGG